MKRTWPYGWADSLAMALPSVKRHNAHVKSDTFPKRIEPGASVALVTLTTCAAWLLDPSQLTVHPRA